MRAMLRGALWICLAGCAADKGNVLNAERAGASPTTDPGSSGARSVVAVSGMAAPSATAGSSGAGDRAAVGGSGVAGSSAGSSAAAGTAGAAGHASLAGSGGVRAAGSGGMRAAGSGGAAGSDAATVYRIALRVHMALSKLTNDELGPIFDELNQIWLTQAGVCFEIEVTNDEANRSDGFDFRYTAGQIPGAPSANGLTQNAHAIWSIDHPNLGAAPHPVKAPTARTTAHELGHALGLAHENPPPSTDCASPCYCDMLGGPCDDYLMRSGTKGFFLSAPEIEIARKHAKGTSLPDTAPSQCMAAKFQR